MKDKEYFNDAEKSDDTIKAETDGEEMKEPLTPQSLNESPERHPKSKDRTVRWKVLIAILLSSTITFALTFGTLFAVYGKTVIRFGGVTLNDLGVEGSILPKEKKTDDKTSGDAKTPDKHKLTMSFPYDQKTDEKLAKFVEIYNLLQKNFYKEMSDAEMLDLMSRGLMNSTESQFTFYLTPEQNAESEQAMSGEYSGVGAVVALIDKSFVVTDVVIGSSAEKEGIKIGDIIIKANGKSASDYTDVSALATEIRGEAGTKVKIEVYRESENKNLSFELERKKITTASVFCHMLEDGVGYVRVSEFSAHVAENFKNAIASLQEQGAKNYVFDFRNNGGGLASECIGILDVLLPKTVVATAKGRQNGEDFTEDWKTENADRLPEDTKYAILINEYTASASELFTGALREIAGAKVVGVKSFGKGVGTLTYKLKDNSAVQITNFRYYLPKGDCIDGIGIEPDFNIALSDAAKMKPLTQLTPEEDKQLAKALELVKP